MFQFKNLGLGKKDSGTSGTFANNLGKVRTFKEDLENFGKGIPSEEITDTRNIPPKAPEEPQPPAPAPEKKEYSEPKVAFPHDKKIAINPFQSIPTPPPVSSPVASPAPGGLPEFKSTPSSDYFAENKSSKTAPPKHAPTPSNNPPSKKVISKFLVFLLIVPILIAAGAGFYYYWFYIKIKTIATPPAGETPVTPPQNTTPAPTTPNKSLQSLVVDTSQSPTEVKNAVQKFATEFAASAGENDLVELKIIGKDNQPIGKKDFFASFGATIPNSTLMKLSEDYSLFAKKEQGIAKLGLVFKTVTSAGLADEMKKWEPTITTDLKPLYLDRNVSTMKVSFSSSKYKNADIRYFNFLSPVAVTSLDYSIISNFLVIGTSKESMRSILDYMSDNTGATGGNTNP